MRYSCDHSENYEANGYGHNFDLLTISHLLCVLYLMRSGCMKKIVSIISINIVVFTIEGGKFGERLIV